MGTGGPQTKRRKSYAYAAWKELAVLDAVASKAGGIRDVVAKTTKCSENGPPGKKTPRDKPSSL